MNNNYIQELKHDTTRQVVIDMRMVEVPIKEYKGWKYVNYNSTKLGLSKIPILKEESEEFNYIFKYGFRKI